ncbi:MAG: ATP-binding protein [Xanthobacteraceae bacterium]
MRVFLSFAAKNKDLAEAVRVGLRQLEPSIDVFFSPVSLGPGLWLPRLADEVAGADAFLLLLGPGGIGPWQEIEYFSALDRHVKDKTFPLVPVIAQGAQAPGLSFLRLLNWVEAPVVTDDKALHRILVALKGEIVPSTSPLWKLVNPYRGLEAMTEAHSDYFYGRTIETSQVLSLLAAKPQSCPILIGASGVGKSSIARAGVLAALKSMRWPATEHVTGKTWPPGLKNSRKWLYLTIRPGERPLQALAAAFIQLWQIDRRNPDHAALPRKWGKALLKGDNSLGDLVEATADELMRREAQAPERTLLYVDQGEELYTRSTEEEGRRFSELLAEALAEQHLVALATLRADYFPGLQADEPLFKCYQHVNVPPFDRDKLHEIVTAPARALEVHFETEEISARITDAAATHRESGKGGAQGTAIRQAGALPLLSYLLTDMWEAMRRRGDATLRLPAQAIDVGGVLASRAEEFLADNPNDANDLRRLLTLRLALVPAEGEAIRRQATQEECSTTEWALAARLADHPWRLTVLHERELDRRMIAEVAHEAFLRGWPRLSHWLRDEREFLVFKSDAERAERRWREQGKTGSALLTGLDLKRAQQWLPSRKADLDVNVAMFLEQSIEAERSAFDRLVQAQKQEAVGQLTTGVAHDFNNLITVILGNLELVRNNLAADNPPPVRRRLDHAIAASQRAAELTRILLTFSRRQTFDSSPVHVNQIIEDNYDAFSRTLGKKIELQKFLALDLWQVLLDVHHLKVSLMNLMSNARDALTNGGQVSIETANICLGEAHTRAPEGKAGEHVVITVTDTGTGMDSDVAKRAFEPFFTTKPPGQGVGLGLSQVQGFVQQSGGYVTIRSEVGGGTTVRMYFPRIE